jgi:CRISPR-associated endonuclease/helicase Cas3
VHNIARSIVILDEVQTLPRRLLGPLLDMMKELAEDWDTNFVFSTATQPAFERPQHKRDLRWGPGTLTEIVRDPASLHKALKRVEIHWEIDHAVGWPEVAQRMTDEPQCLAIVNVRDHAGQLYDEVLRVAEEKGLDKEGVFHLSTRMCAAHRLRMLDKLGPIRKRLNAGESCHVVSTQLVEAGVDVDFPLVLRALAPLDSIVQAAGRADREGKLTAELGGKPGGKVVVFLPVDHKLPPNEYKEAAGITEAIAKDEIESGGSVQVDSADAIRLYFERYYGGSGTDLGQKLVDHREHERFATLAQEFEMISNRTRDVFVPDDEEAQKAIEELRLVGEITGPLRRTLQRHIVGLSPSEFQKAVGVLERVPMASGDEIWVAVNQAYDEQLGLIFNPGPERFML